MLSLRHLFVAPILALVLFFPFVVFGQTVSPGSGGSTVSPGSTGSTVTRSNAVIQNPLASFGSISGFIEALLRALIIIGTPIAVLFIILAGLKFVTAQGNPEALSQARTNFVNTLIGIAIFVGGWAIAQLIKATLEQIGVKF